MNSETIYDTEKSKANGSTTILDNAALSSDADALDGECAEDVCYHKGEIILDTYRVESDAIESGGMGRVWRVHHTGWNVDLAMKRPRAKFFSGDESKQNFIRECDTWIKLGLHPNIVSCYYVRLIDDIPTIFSEWMDGGDLAYAISRGSLYEGLAKNPALVQERILDIAIQFARGLYYAHESRDDSGKPQNLIHRDVKPGNVLLTKNGEVKVSDFGLTKAVTLPSQENQSGDAEASCFKGTPAYCSMEQMDEKPLTLQTDLYSWAVSVMELYVGGHPWANGVVAGLECQKYFEQARVPVPAPMADLLARCLAAEPEDRPHDFGLVIAELRAIYRIVTGEDYPRESSQAAADTADSLNNRALSMLDLGKPKEAEKLWEKGLLANPNHSDLLFNRLLFQLRNNRISAENALRIMRMDFENHFGNSHTSLLCGLIAFENKDMYSTKGYVSRSDEPEAADILSAIESGKPYTCRFILSRVSNYDENMYLQARYTEIEQHIRSLINEDNLDDAMRLFALAGYDPDLQGFAYSPERVKLSEELRKYGFLIYVASVWHVRMLSNQISESICFTPDGNKLLIHNTLYDVKTNDVLCVYENCGSVCSRISPDGKFFLTSDNSNEFSMIDVISGQVRKKVYKLQSTISCMVWSADGTRILIGDENGRIMFFDAKTFDGIATINLEDGPIRKLSIKYDGSEAFVLSDTMLTHLYCNPFEMIKRYMSLTKIYDFCVNLYYDTLAFAYGKYGLYTVDLATGKQTHRTDTRYQEKEYIDPACQRVCFMPNNRWLLCGSNTRLLFWNLDESKIMNMTPCMGRIDRIDISDNEQYLAVMTENGAELFRCDYNYLFAGLTDWSDAAILYLEIFLSLHPEYSESDIDGLIITLQNRGFGFLRREGVKQKLLELSRKRED